MSPYPRFGLMGLILCLLSLACITLGYLSHNQSFMEFASACSNKLPVLKGFFPYTQLQIKGYYILSALFLAMSCLMFMQFFQRKKS